MVFLFFGAFLNWEVGGSAGSSVVYRVSFTGVHHGSTSSGFVFRLVVCVKIRGTRGDP